jgi:16S rRNA (uracil1498-N3)-methyltransferase
MARTRFVVPRLPAARERVALPEAEVAHSRARRLAVGDPVVLMDGSGGEADATITRVSRGAAEVVVETVRAPLPPGPAIWLGVAAVKSDRLAWIAEKSAELEVATLAVVRSERTQAFRAGPATLDRVRRLVREGAKQSGSARWPACEGPLALADALAEVTAASRLFVDFSGEPVPASLPAGAAAILVGPEGGWSDAEREEAARAAWRAVRLPAATTLRTETAAIAAVVLVRAALDRQPERS